MSYRISANWNELITQSQSTSRELFNNALAAIKKELETENRKVTLEEVNLAISLSYVSSIDFACTHLGVLADKLSDSLDSIARALESNE